MKKKPALRRQEDIRGIVYLFQFLCPVSGSSVSLPGYLHCVETVVFFGLDSKYVSETSSAHQSLDGEGLLEVGGLFSRVVHGRSGQGGSYIKYVRINLQVSNK